MRRCSTSVAANLAEGCGKHGHNEFRRYLQIASGSGANWTIICCFHVTCSFSSSIEYDTLVKEPGELRRMLTSLILKVDFERRKGEKSNWQLEICPGQLAS